MSEPKGKGSPRGPHGTRFFGGSSPGAGPQGPGADAEDAGERSARLPTEPPPSSWTAAPMVPVGAKRAKTPRVGSATGPTPLPDGRRSEYADRGVRESILHAARTQRTTFYEVGDLARRLSVVAPGLADASLVTRQIAVSFAIAMVIVLLATMAIAGGTLRLALGLLAGTVGTTLTVFGALRLVSRLGSRRGARALPGSALIWVGGVVFVAAAGTGALTWGVSEVTKPFAPPPVRQQPVASASAVASAELPPGQADARVKRGTFTTVGRGILYVPPSFSSPDGQFDLILHYHGNTELVEASVAAAKVNALVLIINLGDGSDKYSKPLQNPQVFDQLLGSIEASAETGLGLRTPRIRRVALSSWSAGYGAIGQILGSRSRLDRVDALLLMDSIHAAYATGSKSAVHPYSLKPFLAFARRAVAGEKLMVLTHSAIETEGYTSTTVTTDALLAGLGLERRPVTDPAASPLPVKLPVAVNAFPSDERRWLTVVSEAHQGQFFVYGCQGNGKGDHIAHLAQMSVTVLPPLLERWK